MVINLWNVVPKLHQWLPFAHFLVAGIVRALLEGDQSGKDA
jgi:hypothetical protein